MMRNWNLVILSVLLAGCSSNVHGDFACKAPGGTCAPLRSIDEAAVREGGGIVPNAASIDPAFSQRTSSPILAAFSESAPPERTGERVLRVVFPAHVDAQGIYHEPSAVHAVVETPRWSDVSVLGREASAKAPSKPVQQASVVSKRGSALASMDEVIAAGAAREASAYHQQSSFSPPIPPVPAGAGVADETGSVSATPETSVATAMAAVGVVSSKRPIVAAAKPKIVGQTTTELNASSLRRTEAEMKSATIVEMGSGSPDLPEPRGAVAQIPVRQQAETGTVGAAGGKPTDAVPTVNQYERSLIVGPGAQQ